MKRFHPLKHRSSAKFLRAVGITREQCVTLRDKILVCIQAEQEAQPMKKRGKKTVTVTVEDQWLLPLTYLRQYPTFEQLGQPFGIWESSAHKV
jgi:hypothetical protein